MEALRVADESLDQWLQSALRQGQLESSGTWSVDLSAALRKFQEYALSEPVAAVARLIRCGVVSGAPSIHVQLERKSARVGFAAFSIGLEQLGQAFDRVLSDVPAERELAIALNSLQKQKLEQLTVTRLEPSRIAQLHVDANRQAHYGSAMDLSRTETLTQVHWRQREGRNVRQELRQLSDWFQYSPVPITVNGVQLQREFGSPRGPGPLRHLGAAPQVLIKAAWYRPASYFWADHHALEFRLFSPVPERNEVRRPEDTRASTRLSAGAPRGPRCFLLLGFRCDLRETGQMDWVYRGQLVDSTPEQFPFPGVHAVVSCEGLRFDITGEKPVAGSALMARRRFVVDWVNVVDDYLQERHGESDAKILYKLLYDPQMKGRTVELPRTPRVQELLRRMS